MKATEITSTTLVGVGRQERPQQRGNCFSVKVEGEQYERRISNFNLENLEALIEKGLTWPIEVEPLGECNALVMDARIGERWYDQRYCEICTPRTLLPSNQIAAHQRKILRCEITEHVIMNGPFKGHIVQSGQIPPKPAEFP